MQWNLRNTLVPAIVTWTLPPSWHCLWHCPTAGSFFVFNHFSITVGDIRRNCFLTLTPSLFPSMTLRGKNFYRKKKIPGRMWPRTLTKSILFSIVIPGTVLSPIFKTTSMVRRTMLHTPSFLVRTNPTVLVFFFLCCVLQAWIVR